MKSDKVSKESVDYRRGSGSRNCGNCSMFRQDGIHEAQGSCTLVAGHIRAGDTCDRWEKKS